MRSEGGALKMALLLSRAKSGLKQHYARRFRR